MNNTNAINTLQAQMTRMMQSNQIQNAIYGSNPNEVFNTLKSYPYISLSLQNLATVNQVNTELCKSLFNEPEGKGKTAESWKILYDSMTEAVSITGNCRMTMMAQNPMMLQMQMNSPFAMQSQMGMFVPGMQMASGNTVSPNATSDINQLKEYVKSNLMNTLNPVDPLIFLQILTRRGFAIELRRNRTLEDLLKRALIEAINTLQQYQFDTVLAVFCGQCNGQNAGNNMMGIYNNQMMPGMFGGMNMMWPQAQMMPNYNPMQSFASVEEPAYI